MFNVHDFEQQTQCLNPQPPVRPVPDELIRDVMVNGYLEEDEKYETHQILAFDCRIKY